MSFRRSVIPPLTLLAAAIWFAGCGSKETEPAKESRQAEQAAPPAKPAEEPAKPAPAGAYKVLLDTSKGPIVIEVHPDWAPLGAQHFRELVKAGFYNGARFFRVVPNFVVQFGLAANPAVTKKWETPIKD